MKEDKEVDALLDLHYEIKGFLDNQDFKNVVAIFDKLLAKPEANELKTALIITKSFKDHEIIAKPRKKVLKKLESIVGKQV